MKSLQEVLESWEAVIGLEIHTELTTLETKMFCSCRLSHDDEPNTNVCPVCLGMPGALPVPNRQAIRSIVKAGLATNCEIQKRSMFYRKHYFYPDMAKNFQTTQGPVAFCMHGHLDLTVEGEGAKERPANSKNVTWSADKSSYSTHVRILRIHMEEDAAKMIHVGGEEGRIASATESLIDYNRCGTPLIELVTEPDLRTPEEARLFMEKLRRTFLALGISDCSMENGSMRCDGNVSLRRRGDTALGTKTELKNLNSFKSLHDGLEYEIRRQAEVLEMGGEVFQETRHWEPSRRRTVVMRVKETADDYRLFPDPDLAPFDLSDEFIDECRAELPELPEAKAARYVSQYGLKPADAAQLAGSPEAASFFEASVAEKPAATKPALAVQVANLLVNDVAGYLKSAGSTFADTALTPAQVVSLAGLLSEGAISAKQGREVVELMAASGKDAVAIVDERGMRQVTDDSALQPIVDEVIAACPDQVQQFRDGNSRVVGFLVGQCMKRAKGNGNPKRFNELLVASMAAASEKAPAQAAPAGAAEPKPTTPAKAAAKPDTAAKPVKPAAKKPAAKKPAAKKPAAKKAASAKPAKSTAVKKPVTAKPAKPADSPATAQPADIKPAQAAKTAAVKPAKPAASRQKAVKPAAKAEAEGSSSKTAKSSTVKQAAARPAAAKKTAAAKAASPSKPAATTKAASTSAKSKSKAKSAAKVSEPKSTGAKKPAAKTSRTKKTAVSEPDTSKE